MALKVQVVSRIEAVWWGEATKVIVPSVEGEMGVLPGRQSVMGVLKAGTVRIGATDEKEVSVTVDGGFFSVDNDIVTVAAETAELL